MDKTININLAGVLFQIDEEAYRILRDYLQAINNRFENVPGGHETIEDIESRIAEIFQSQKGVAGVITKENVEKMIAVIGKPEDFDSEESVEPPVYRKKRMYRNPDDKIIGGVCSGMAAYLDTDPVLFRILFVLFTAFFGVGFFVYLGLWIALPVARTDAQKRDLYSYQGKPYDVNNPGYTRTSPVSNAFNEVFRAIGKLFYIIFRIFMIILGIAIMLTGFLFIMCFIAIFVFKFPGVYSFDAQGMNLIYIPDFLHYIVNSAAVPWIMILTSIAFLLPMLALVYWGVKMIFWFRARDGVVSLVALVVWVISIAALAIIGFNEGVSFARTAHVTTESVSAHAPDTLFIHSDMKLSELKYQKEISLPHDEYSVYINEDKKELYIRPFLYIERSSDKSLRMELRKNSSGRTETEASQKTEDLSFNCRLSNDSLRMDEYFTIPSGRKWASDNIGINLQVPEGTIVKFEKSSRIPVRTVVREYDDDNERIYSYWQSSAPGYWIMTEDGLETYSKESSNKK